MSLIFDLIINPLVFIYDLVFGIAFKICSAFNVTDRADYALPIIAVSIMVNLLTLPLYTRADKIQEEEREKQKKMKPMVDHINKAFKGDERFMMLSTYYRQMNYKPIYAIRASVSLLLQIPFFTAAYRFFTTARFLEGQGAFLINTNTITFLFSDLSKPDRMFIIGALVINILPIIMTLINFVSSAIYTKGFALKDRLQPFILAIAFLVILYNSPSGLVIYWTCNNIIALIKIVVIKLIKVRKKETIPDKISNTITKIKDKVLPKKGLSKKELAVYNKIAVFSALSFGAFVGLLIPTQIITSAPYDFIGWYSTFWPYIRYTGTTYVGMSLWIILFYCMSRESVKKNFALCICCVSIISIINYFCFYVDFGYLSPLLRYDDKEVIFKMSTIIINLIVVIIISVIIFNLNKNKPNIVFLYAPTIILISFLLMTVLNVILTKNQLEFHGEKKKYSSSVVLKSVDKNVIETTTQKIKASLSIIDISEIEDNMEDINTSGITEIIDNSTMIKELEEKKDKELFPVKPIYKLSKNGKNVLLLMIDKFQGAYFPYLLKEKPILKEQFKGFTYYPNTISYGLNTLYGTPGLFGGYEYIPIEHDRHRPYKLIKENQNEALKVLPKMFHNEGFNTIVSNVPYENYGERTNSIYDYDDPSEFIATRSNLNGKTKSKSVLLNIDNSMEGLKRNFLYYGLMKTSPIIIQKQIYDNGRYLSANASNTMLYDMAFIGSFAVLERIGDYAKIVDDDSNNFFMMDNGAVHQPNMLSYPEFMPLPYTDNIADKVFYDENGNEFKGSKTYFTSTMGVTLLLGKFFDYLRECGVYDNTRIVVVADHGYPTDRWEEYLVAAKLDERKQVTINNIDFTGRNATYILGETDNSITFSLLGLNPILLYKDFNSNDEIITSYDFMTNADSPSLCIQNLLESNINPYTGNEINMNYKKDNLNYITLGHHWQAQNRRNDLEYQYPGELWAIIKDNIFDKSSWKITYDKNKY